MQLILTWEEPQWRVYAVEPELEGAGPTLDEAFTALYAALAEGPQGDAVPVHHVQDYKTETVGIYRIQLTECGADRLMARSTDILGLAIDGSAEEVFLALPDLISDILSEQPEFTTISAQGAFTRVS